MPKLGSWLAPKIALLSLPTLSQSQLTFRLLRPAPAVEEAPRCGGCFLFVPIAAMLLLLLLLSEPPVTTSYTWFSNPPNPAELRRVETASYFPHWLKYLEPRLLQNLAEPRLP